MKADFFYKHWFGRAMLKFCAWIRAPRLGAWFLRSPLSKGMIAPFIRRNNVDMSAFRGQTYHSYAEFFSRDRGENTVCTEPDALISPCDGLVSIYPITDTTALPMKGSLYRVADLIPDPETAEKFAGGLCFVFRLEATDYHRFCYFDDCVKKPTQFVPGHLHSVQPIACQTVPVYRLNRRWWTVLETAHFGEAVQVEIGAMLVGGVRYAQDAGSAQRGAEMGTFLLAGSTIAVFLKADIRSRLVISPQFLPARDGKREVRVRLGEKIGCLK